MSNETPTYSPEPTKEQLDAAMAALAQIGVSPEDAFAWSFALEAIASIKADVEAARADGVSEEDIEEGFDPSSAICLDHDCTSGLGHDVAFRAQEFIHQFGL